MLCNIVCYQVFWTVVTGGLWSMDTWQLALKRKMGHFYLFIFIVIKKLSIWDYNSRDCILEKIWSV